MLARFGYVGQMKYYTNEEMQKVVLRSAKLLNIACEPQAALELGKRSRGTPRVANRLLRRARDFADVRGNGTITCDIVLQTCKMLGVDDIGLDERDRAILTTIAQHYGGGPVGIKNIAVVIGEETDTIEDVYEPYLIQCGFLKRTPQGREITENAYKMLGLTPKRKKIGKNDLQTSIFDEY
jgi:Holliday junction DNA helicase RuvB